MVFNFSSIPDVRKQLILTIFAGNNFRSSFVNVFVGNSMGRVEKLRTFILYNSTTAPTINDDVTYCRPEFNSPTFYQYILFYIKKTIFNLFFCLELFFASFHSKLRKMFTQIINRIFFIEIVFLHIFSHSICIFY